MKTTFQQALAHRDGLERDVALAESELRKFPRNAMGLVPDAARTPAYHEARRAFQSAFNLLQTFNAWFVKAFAKDLREARNGKRRKAC